VHICHSLRAVSRRKNGSSADGHWRSWLILRYAKSTVAHFMPYGGWSHKRVKFEFQTTQLSRLTSLMILLLSRHGSSLQHTASSSHPVSAMPSWRAAAAETKDNPLIRQERGARSPARLSCPLPCGGTAGRDRRRAQTRRRLNRNWLASSFVRPHGVCGDSAWKSLRGCSLTSNHWSEGSLDRGRGAVVALEGRILCLIRGCRPKPNLRL